MHTYVRATPHGRLIAQIAICSIAVALIGAGTAHARGRYQTQLDQVHELLGPPAANARELMGAGVPISTARCRDWTVSKRLADRPQLVVTALCAVRGGERLELRRHDPQGINPADLLLELVVRRSPFPPGPASSQVRVTHIEPDAGYKTVTILPDGPTLPVDGLS